MTQHEFTPDHPSHPRYSLLGTWRQRSSTRSPLLQYINIKTRSASRGSKSRSSFANLYAIYVLVEDTSVTTSTVTGYGAYPGANFSDLFRRQEPPFGERLQNHALTHRLNEEFHRLFPAAESLPIIRETATTRYFFNENLLKVQTSRGVVDISRPVLAVLDAYIAGSVTPSIDSSWNASDCWDSGLREQTRPAGSYATSFGRMWTHESSRSSASRSSKRPSALGACSLAGRGMSCRRRHSSSTRPAVRMRMTAASTSAPCGPLLPGHRDDRLP